MGGIMSQAVSLRGRGATAAVTRRTLSRSRLSWRCFGGSVSRSPQRLREVVAVNGLAHVGAPAPDRASVTAGTTTSRARDDVAPSEPHCSTCSFARWPYPGRPFRRPAPVGWPSATGWTARSRSAVVMGGFLRMRQATPAIARGPGGWPRRVPYR